MLSVSFDWERLWLHVSADQEDITLACRMGTETRDLGARAHHELLLQLARARAADSALPSTVDRSRGNRS